MSNVNESRHGGAQLRSASDGALRRAQLLRAHRIGPEQGELCIYMYRYTTTGATL